MIILSVSSFYGDWANWLPLSLLATMMAILIASSLVIFARIFSIRELEAYGNSEIMQALATGFMAIFLISLITGATAVARTFIAGDIGCSEKSIHIGTTDKSTMDEAFSAIRCRIQSRSKELAEIQSNIMTDSGIAARFNVVNLAFSLFGITVFKGDWVTSLYKETETIRIISNLTTVTLIALNAQSFFIEYLKNNMIHVFIPFGILLRSFYFTRSVGGLMIALGIGMYFLFPVFYILLDPGFVPSKPPLPSRVDAKPFCYATMSSTVTTLRSIESTGLGGTSQLTLDSLKEDLSKSYLSLILHPFIAFSLTMVFVRYLMSVLGADTYEMLKLASKVI